ncbi:phytanoyl-CoA dioxygenase family protein [Paraburkholderia sp. Ac-20347]|uniref:phytanoyl-CoA dioxygenase family protein n=1 Tax=Paraburkholderia sp. Ac-20347 TaxID=2703892 RepID=UPI0019810A29|nr:phytanoyl-CoA dioxygenase family protein [Paraburkholderia sp. Ac-20347]MBN3813285.1 phytanoyl-CoA dioxygenase family protein [Paraburkholderia sp. Ac-20347]
MNDRRHRFFDSPVTPETSIDIVTQNFRHKDFPATGPIPWLDRPDAVQAIDSKLIAGEISEAEAEMCRRWERDGYLIIEKFFSDEQLDQAWQSYEDAISAGTIVPPHEPLFDGDEVHGRILNPHFKLESIKQMLFDERMRDIVSLLLGVRALPFQTIIGHKSSEQLQHSDSIHMSTYPTGYLAANWIAFEDIHEDSGPLVYHPGSHKLPYLMADELGIPFDVGYGGYHTTYEPAVQKLIADHRFETKYFLPKKGDILLWHANLLHGGSKLATPENVSRKALVCHFFAEGCLCYHDLTGMPAHITPAVFDSAAYLAAYPDVAAAGVDPYIHYMNGGKEEGRIAFLKKGFDGEAYLEANPDLRGVVGSPHQHFVHFGRKEGRPLGSSS